MIIKRLKEGKGFILYQRLRRSDNCPKYFIIDDISSSYVGEYRRYTEAERKFKQLTK